MDKFSDFFKASVAVFHGIIATWLFLNFSETSVDEFQFLLLVVCFAVVNVLTWNFIVLAFLRMTRGAGVSVPLMTGDIARLSYRTVDVIGLTLIAVFFAAISSDRVKCRRQQIKTAVKVCNCVCEVHAAPLARSDQFIPHEECNLPLRRNRFF